jgi:hypothetical protein
MGVHTTITQACLPVPQQSLVFSAISELLMEKLNYGDTFLPFRKECFKKAATHKNGKNYITQ